jgi:hypothetical protein
MIFHPIRTETSLPINIMNLNLSWSRKEFLDRVDGLDIRIITGLSTLNEM